jgi:aldehyde dehydrogenase (NAD+)
MHDFDPASVAVPQGHYIDGKIVEDRNDLTVVVRPTDSEAYGDLPLGDAAIVDRAVQAAKKAFRHSGWSTRAPRERATILRRLADLIERDTVELARLEAIGSTRPVSQAIGGDIPYLAETFRFFAELADKRGGQVAATQSDRFGFVAAEPYGVIAAILPWNYPLSMAGWKLGPILASGNCVVLKPSELTPFSVLKLAMLATEAGLPNGVLNIVQGDGPRTGSALVRHPDVGKVTFTGSTQAGAAIMVDAANSGIKPVTLELGGKSPQVVFGDCDLDIAAACVAGSILSNAGQECVAGSRVIAQRGIADELVEKLRVRLAKVTPGPTWSGTSQYAPIVSRRQMAAIDTIVGQAVSQGAEALLGGRRFDGPFANFYRPTILANVSAGNPAVTQEIFGPVLTVQTFDDDDEAVALANDSIYGLAAGIYTRNLSRTLGLAKRIEVGTIWVNRYGRTDDFIIPTGGYKSSGFGKDLGYEAFDACLRTKSVLIDIV